MRTDEEILARIAAVEKNDFFGFIRSDLLAYLPFSAAKAFLKDEVTEDQWKPTPRDHDSVVAEIKSYMEFAWGKANNCRGLSAGRSVQHFEAWAWMACEDGLLARMDARAYEYYGKPQLRLICEHFGWDWRAWDDNQWRNDEGRDGISADEVPL